MFIAILTLLSALSISGVAAYYSIIGLATIFPGAFLPVVLMGSVLEAGKLVCASWLYRNWKQTNILLRSYLFFAVIVLSLVTSMGIFGFLSKAHLQNEFADGSVQQKIELINSQIKTEESIIIRQQEIINRAFGKDTSTTLRLNQLNERLKQLDNEVEAYTAQGSSFLKGDLVKKGLELKKTQQVERDAIQKEIQSLTNKSNASTVDAENKIARSQQKITDLISKRDPLIADKLKLEAEIGPIKYIAALAVDFGWSEKVDANSAVRWVIIILIFVFDPLAVLMLVAANQSFIRKFPVREDPPEEIIDLEKPDLDPPFVPTRTENNTTDPVTQWNHMIEQANAELKKEREEKNRKFEEQLKEWQEKLERFNEKVEKPQPKNIEIIPIQEDTKKENENTVSYSLGNVIVQDDIDSIEEERYKPDLTEVIEPENTIKKPKIATIGQVVVNKKSGAPIKKILNDEERKHMLNIFHHQHGKYEDVSDEDLKKERDEDNKRIFLSEVKVTEEDSRNHPPITPSRKAFFQDYVDDVLRGNITAEQLPPDVAKTVAIILSEFPDPTVTEIVDNTKSNIETLTSEGLKEKFIEDPDTEDRDITNSELDDLISKFEEDNQDLKEFDILIKDGKKIKIPKKNYVQNEEQGEATQWNKIKELELPEPEKNEIILPEPEKNEPIVDVELTNLNVEEILPNNKIQKHKSRMISDEEYRQRIEQRINDLISKLDRKEISLNEISEDDKKIIKDILDSNG